MDSNTETKPEPESPETLRRLARPDCPDCEGSGRIRMTRREDHEIILEWKPCACTLRSPEGRAA
jgi:DnaJ-class molecular chaperone